MNPIRFPYQIVMAGLLLIPSLAYAALEIKAKADKTATTGDIETWVVQVELENNTGSETGPLKCRNCFSGHRNGILLCEFADKIGIGTKSALPLNPPPESPLAEAHDGSWHLVTDGRAEFSGTIRGVPVPKVFAILLGQGSAYHLLGRPYSVRSQKTAATENLKQTMNEIDRLHEMSLNKLAHQFTGTSFQQEYQLARNPIANAKSKPAAPPPP